jgi:DNA-binding beta-propeller fold protein YncE
MLKTNMEASLMLKNRQSSKSIVATITSSVLFLTLFFSLNAADGYHVRTVDFLRDIGMSVNGAGPLLVKTDIKRNRLILVNTNTSSVSIISGKNHSVKNIAMKSRVPQYVKMAALSIDDKTGNIYVIGTQSLHIVFPNQLKSITIATGEQYEMVAIEEKSGNAFLVGRESKYLLKVNLKSQQIKRFPWLQHTEPMLNLNMTPPPPIRKVVCDNVLGQIIAIDGFTATLFQFSTKSGKLIKKRKLPVTGGTRWHFAGYNQVTHNLYTVIESAKREVRETIKIDILKAKDTTVKMPGLTEAVGIIYNPSREEVYIPYDNHPTVHVVDFKVKVPTIDEIKVPNFGNDATAIDQKNHLLYVASWGYGEVEVIDLKTRKLVKVISDTGIIPHMFSMAFNPHNRHLYIPVGASAVNGSFGASLNLLNPQTESQSTIYTGWAPTAIVPLKDQNRVLVFNSENQMAIVTPEGSVTYRTLPCRFINNAKQSPSGKVYVSYGPHQSYWPTVYIWAAKNGILSFDPDQLNAKNLPTYDRRIPRMAQQMTFDKQGAFYALQNNWGGEDQFLTTFSDDVRNPNLGSNQIKLTGKVIRETTQRILTYDPDTEWLYIVKVGETDDQPGTLEIYDIKKEKTLLAYPTGLTPTDLIMDDNHLYIANFDSNTITAVNKNDFSVQKFKTDAQPFKLAKLGASLYTINHRANTLQSFNRGICSGTFSLPFNGKPANLFSTGKHLIITGHTPDSFFIFVFDPLKKSFNQVEKAPYPYGETALDSRNSAFYMGGQFGDGIFQLNQIIQDHQGRIWISDYLSGKCFIMAR